MNSVQTAMITGATAGIGHGLSRLFAVESYRLDIATLDEEKIQEDALDLEALSGHYIYPLAKDQFKRKTALEIYDEVRAINVAIELLINNAAQSLEGAFADSRFRGELSNIQSEICSLVSRTHQFLEDSLDQCVGKSQDVSSVAKQVSGPWQAVYDATHSFVQSFREDMAVSGLSK